MTNELERKSALERIRQNIVNHGYHTYVVTGGGDPHYAYTIGLRQSLGAELVFAGGYFYLLDEFPKIIEELVTKLKTLTTWESARIELGSWGTFSFRVVHSSWANKLMLGALDFYQVERIPAFQIVPDDTHWTIEIPNLSEPWSSASAPAWRWLQEQWTYPVPVESVGITNLAAMRGERVTEVMRWEGDEWELFAGAGPDIPKKELRVVPLGTLVALDESLLPIMNLDVGSGMWRDTSSEWHSWGAGSRTRK